jgi:hypothetical protein
MLMIRSIIRPDKVDSALGGIDGSRFSGGY